MRWQPRGDRDRWLVALVLFLVAVGLRSLAWHGHLGYAISLLAASENPLANLGAESGEREGLAIYLVYWLLEHLFDPGPGSIIPQQLVSFVSYCAITPAVYLLCAELDRPWTGAAGGALYALLPASYIDASAVNYVGFYVALSIWGFWLLLRTLRVGRISAAVAAALVIGAGVFVRVSILLVPLVLLRELVAARRERSAKVFVVILLPILLLWLVSVGGPTSYLSYRKRDNLAFAFELNDPAQIELTMHRFSARAGHIVGELFTPAAAESTIGLLGLIAMACIPFFVGRTWRSLAAFVCIDFVLFAAYAVDDLYAQHLLPLLSAFLFLPLELLVIAVFRNRWHGPFLFVFVAAIVAGHKIPYSLATARELHTEEFREEFEGPMYPYLLVDERLLVAGAPETDRVLVPNRDVCYGWRSDTRVLALADHMSPQNVDEGALCELLASARIDYVAARSFEPFERFQEALRIGGMIEEQTYRMPTDALQYDFDELEALQADFIAERLGYFPPSLFAEYRLSRLLARLDGRHLGASRLEFETAISYRHSAGKAEADVLLYRVYHDDTSPPRRELDCSGSCCKIVPDQRTPTQPAIR
ncbi:MAG: hypothetical protein CME06_03145 [Gemmatimonadetes bacterium]|nr:hypothetical protein [Gemmatimonadota bacterium]